MTDGNAMDSLIAAAWSARENAWAWRSGTKVGCCLLTKSGKTYIGWNTEGPWGTSTHAERAAVASMADHADRITAVAVVAETERFTPCGACMDWLIQFASNGCILATENKHRERIVYHLRDLMPHYPVK